MKVIEAVKYLQKLVVQKYEELENVLIGLFEEIMLNCSNNSPLLVKKLQKPNIYSRTVCERKRFHHKFLP